MGVSRLSVEDLFFPGIAGVSVERVAAFMRELLVEALSNCPSRPCPDCGAVSRRVHSRYCRTLADSPVGGRPLLVRLTVRRFFCDSPTCLRRTFVEQVAGLTERHQKPLLYRSW
jgi:transposase